MFEAIWLIVPLIIIGAGSLLVLLMGTSNRLAGESCLFYASMITIILAIFELLLRWHAPFSLEFGHSFQFDDEATLFKIVILIIEAIILIYARPTLENIKSHLAETYSLILLSCLGMMLLVSAMHLLTVFLGIELMSLPLYALVAIYRDNKSATEAALKYFVMGALSSGLMLFGFAWLYGATGTMDLSEMPGLIAGANHAWLLLSEILLVAGIAFKFGAAPFHMWVPDVYQAAPTPVTALIASAPKVAMTALLLHFMQALANIEFSQMLLVIAVISMLLGNIIALAQENIKRMLAYSSVGHMGLVLLAVAVNSHAAMQAAVFYIVSYALTAVLVFSVLMQLKVNYQDISFISELSGIAQRYSIQAFAILFAMFSMAGVPPLVGFMAKFMVLDVVIAHKQYLLSGILVISSVIGAVYYLRVIKTIYFKETKAAYILLSSALSNVLLKLNALAIFLFGCLPFIIIAPIKAAFA